MQVDLTDDFWAPRVEQLRTTTLEVILDRLEGQGVVDNFRRLATSFDGPRRALHFCDSDLYKWVEAAAIARRTDLAQPVVDLIEAVQQPDGYLHTHYGIPDGPPRYSDLDFGHEHYCFGHLLEAAIAHHQATGSEQLLTVARRLADHVCAAFGPGRDERADAHPEIELALCRLASATGEGRYLDHAAWIIRHQVEAAGFSLATLPFSGHAVRALYLASGIAEVALATGEHEWSRAALRLFDSMVHEHAYPTGAVGGRWLGEAVGQPYEQPDTMAYAESCAAVAATQFAARIWRLTGDPRALDQVELLLFNAVPCGVGADGRSWFYSQPQAVAEVAPDPNPWVYGFDYGQQMLLQWFPARRHRWFAVPCCPPNLARLYAGVGRYVAEVDHRGDLLVHLPVASRLRGEGWDVEIEGRYPDDGDVQVTIHEAPSGGSVRVRQPGWAGGTGHHALPDDGRLALPVDWQWWTTDHRVESGADRVHLRRGPVVHCVEGVDHPQLDLRDLVVDPRRSPTAAFARRAGAATGLHHPVAAVEAEPVTVTTRPYAEWANRDPTTMRVRFPVAALPIEGSEPTP